MSTISLQSKLPQPAPTAVVRVLATNDMLGTVIPMPATYGNGGSISGVIELFERQSESMPAVWVDSGDLTMGGERATFGSSSVTELGPLPLSVAAVGNHELDDGLDALGKRAAKLPFPLVCADRDIGLPPTAMIETPGGLIGILGVTHRFIHKFSAASPSATHTGLIGEYAHELRRSGARWVLALLHDGATWWASATDRSAETRALWLRDSAAPWAQQVDAILGGHTLAAWTGHLHGTPAGHAHPYAASVLPVDLCTSSPHVRIHRPVRVPPVTPVPATRTIARLQAAATRTIGTLANSWESRPRAPHYLPRLVATAYRASSGADAAFVPASQLLTQAPVDGTVAALRAGSVTELDILRLFPFVEDAVAIVELDATEFRQLVHRHDSATDPTNTSADSAWWNWARAPAGIAADRDDPTTLAVMEVFVPLLESWIGRALAPHRSGASAREAVKNVIMNGEEKQAEAAIQRR